MFNPFAQLKGPVPAYLVEFLSIKNKAELEKYSRKIEITSHDFSILIYNAASIGYEYAIQTHESRPKHLEPNNADITALHKKNPQPFIRKVSQILKERRVLVSHMFYNSTRWHLFYSDQRDREEGRQNHWVRGSHIHFVNDLWPGYDPEKLWDIFSRADATAGGKLYIPFKNVRYDKASCLWVEADHEGAPDQADERAETG
jgi:hypothetical protein